MSSCCTAVHHLLWLLLDTYLNIDLPLKIIPLVEIRKLGGNT